MKRKTDNSYAFLLTFSHTAKGKNQKFKIFVNNQQKNILTLKNRLNSIRLRWGGEVQIVPLSKTLNWTLRKDKSNGKL